jgi:hypothetical protein
MPNSSFANRGVRKFTVTFSRVVTDISTRYLTNVTYAHFVELISLMLDLESSQGRAVSRRLLTAAGRVRFQVSSCG